jgi:signal transduction histidine kinase/CheY-like chemotaxis protein
MKKVLALFFVFLFQFTELSAFAATGIKNSEQQNNSLWFFLSLIMAVLVLLLTYFLYQKQKKAEKEKKEHQQNYSELKQKLTALTKNRKAVVQQRITQIENERDQLRENLKAMKETLEAGKLSAQRNALLMTRISNTLRTNLNDILGFSGLMGNEFALAEDPELFEYNENIKKSGEALLHLLNNIIDISKIESKNFQLNESACNISEITKQLIEKFKPLAETKGIQLVYQENDIPVFSADNQAVQHILTNLLDNAVRYTEKGFIKISHTFQNNEIVWRIKDTGIGIDKAFLPDIFEPFRQQTLGYSKNTFQGAGLGLPLVKNMLQIMGGRIEIESEKAVGTTVTVYFPFKKFTPRQTETKREKTTLSVSSTVPSLLSPKGKHILILDEDKLESMLMKKILTDAHVTLYDNLYPPEEWFTQIVKQQKPIDLLIIDLDFSGKNRGAEFYESMKKDFPALGKIPALALSADPGRQCRQKASQAGFPECLQKPFRKNDLISAINSLLSV